MGSLHFYTLFPPFFYSKKPALYPVTRPPPVTIPPIIQLPAAAWPPATNLVVGDNRKLRQSNQHPDVRLCISEATNRASANLFFLDAFPNLHTRNAWLSQSLFQELANRSETNLFLREVNERARQDEVYFGHLISMVCEYCAGRNTTLNDSL